MGPLETFNQALDEAGEVPCQNAPELYFPDEPDERPGGTKGSYFSMATALRGCAECPVREACLTYALEAVETHGIWGGTTPRQRQQLNSRRRDRASVPARAALAG